MIDATLFSRPVDLAEIPDLGTSRTVDASPEERRAIADAYGLREVRTLTGEARFTPVGRTGYLVEGRVRADIVQTCVVSLVPVDQSIDEPFSVRFSRDAADRIAAQAHPGAEIELNLAAGEPPEPLSGSSIDLGQVVLEHFVLAIDPYPRAPGAQLPPEAAASLDAEEISPFAALAQLRRGTGEPD
jgi:hypothetical protein